MALSLAQLKRSLHLTEAIEKLQDELNLIYATLSNAVAPEIKTRKKRRGGMSAAGRARVAAAQKARWAKIKGGVDVGNPDDKKAKRNMSAAGKARIAAAQKKRWAKVKAGKK